MTMNLYFVAIMLLASSIPRIYAASPSSSCFVSISRRALVPSLSNHNISLRRKLSASSSSEEDTQQKINVSRLSTLQTLLTERGAPGSIGCNQGSGDLIPIDSSSATSDEYKNLHPHLLPLAKSKSSGNIICALRRAYADDADYDSPSLVCIPRCCYIFF